MVLVNVALVWALAAVTPGPNLLITLRSALQGSRARAVTTVFGICCGTLVWGLSGFFGVSAVIAASPDLYQALRILGCGYLAYIAVRIAFAVPVDVCDDRDRHGTAQAWRQGFLTNIANPKTMLFVAGLFAATMPPSPPWWLGFLAVAIMCLVSFAWYSSVACLFSRFRPPARLRRPANFLLGSLILAASINLMMTA